MANQMRVEPKFKKIISKSTLIHQGPPARYQLKPQKESLDGERQEESRLRRWTLGEKNHNKVNKTILLVGQTGTGKSTMINALVNYVMGVEMDDKIWFEIVEEEKKSPSESQTSAVTVYDIFGFEDGRVPFSLTIIDTPGYGDTKGIREDAIIAEKLNDLFRSENGIHEIDAVAFVVRSSINRLDDKMKYIFDSVMSLFGKDMQTNIVILMTCSNRLSATNVLKGLEDADIKCAKHDNDQAVNFLFDNCQSTAVTNENKRALKFAWETSEEGVEKLLHFLDGTKPQNLKVTVDVLTDHVRLKACIENLQDRIKFIQLKQNLFHQTQEALKNYKQEIQTNKDITIEVDEPYKEKVPIDAWWDTKAVCCTVCEENCHYPGCTMAPNPSFCEVMKKNAEDVLRCTSCANRCTPDKHVKENWQYELKTRKACKTLEEIIKNSENYQEDFDQKLKDIKYENKKIQDVAENKERYLSRLKAALKSLEDNKTIWVEEAYQHVVRLEEIALNTGSLSVQVHLDLLIEMMKETGYMEKVQKLEEIKRVGEGREPGVSYIKAAQEGGWRMSKKSKLEEEPDSKPEEGPDSKLEDGPDSKLEDGPDSKLEDGPDSKPEEGPDSKPEEGPDSKPEEGPDSKPEEGPDSQSNTNVTIT